MNPVRRSQGPRVCGRAHIAARGLLDGAAVLAVLVAAGLVLGGPQRACAHALAPSLLALDEQVDGTVSVTWKTPLLRPAGVEIEPVLPAHCTRQGEGELRVEDRAAIHQWSLRCGVDGLAGRTVGVAGLERSRTATLLRVRLASGDEQTTLLRGGAASFTIAEEISVLAVARRYALLGVEHIWLGIDHLLFVLGLILLIANRRLLVWTITGFTLGHSLTLAAAVLGWLQLPSALVEVGIAVTLVVVAVELAHGERAEPGLLRRRPYTAAVGFGLLHGLGFAGALREVGLPPADIPAALLAFNLGIEVGQLAFVAAALLVGWALAPALQKLGTWPRRVPAYAIGSLAVYWCIERSAGLWS